MSSFSTVELISLDELIFYTELTQVFNVNRSSIERTDDIL